LSIVRVVGLKYVALKSLLPYTPFYWHVVTLLIEVVAAMCCFASFSRAGELRFGSCDATLRFLPEHLIPKDFKRHIEEVQRV
jgi:hypothetical protein